MYVKKTKRIVMLGVMAALSTIFCVLSTVISINTIFFTAAAAFLVGIVVILYGMGAGSLYFVGCLVLDFFLNPNKFHGFLYLALAGYILVCEGSYRLVKKEKVHRVLRFVIFGVCYVPLVLFLPRLLLSETFYKNTWFFPAMFGIGVIVWVLYDLAYMGAKKWMLAKFAPLFHVVKDNS